MYQMASKEEDSVKLKKTLVIAQEISLVKTLCNNDQKVRHRGLYKLGRWLRSRCQGLVELNENDFNRLWKGLFYCLWMADKLLYQEEVADLISQIIHCFPGIDTAIAFIKSFFKIVGQEWPGIDQLRMDKCMMLVRRMVRQSFVILSKNDWNEDYRGKLAACYRKSLDIIPDGLAFHFSDIYVNELSKIGDNEINSCVVLDLVRPFAEYMSTLSNGHLINHIASTVFLNLMRLSDKGVEHDSRFRAWRDRGLPGGTIEVIRSVDPNGNVASDEDNDDYNDDMYNSNDSEDDKVLDPRAGLIDVELPTLNIDPQQLINMFQLLRTDKLTTTKARKQIIHLINKFTIFSAGRYPLGLQKFETVDEINWKNKVRYTAKELIKFESNDCIGHKNGSGTFTNKNLDICTENSGIWQVTPVKEGQARRKKRRLSESINTSSNWIVEDKTECGRSKSENCEESLKQDILNGYSEQDAALNSICLADKPETERSNETESDSETEVLIKQPKINSKRKRKSPRLNGINAGGLNISNGSVSLKKESVTPSTPPSESTGVTGANGTPNVSSSTKKKRVAFLLNKNMVQEEREYLRLIKNQPTVTHDGEKRPSQPIYKDKGVRSPINPFYKRVGFTSL